MSNISVNTVEFEQEVANKRSYLFLGARLDALSDLDVVHVILKTIERGESRIIGNHNMHSLYLWHHEPKMQTFYACADYAYIDGMLLTFLGRIFGLPLRRADSATYLEFLPCLARIAVEQQWRIFFLGARAGVADAAAEKLRKQYPGLQIQTHHGHFDLEQQSNDNQKVLSEINAYSPHILMVGMGMPRQEVWIAENRQHVKANIISSTGAIMDYIAGVKSAAPRWLRPLYLEWSSRLLTEPTRLWRRYLVEPWFLLRLIARRCVVGASQSVATHFIKPY